MPTQTPTQPTQPMPEAQPMGAAAQPMPEPAVTMEQQMAAAMEETIPVEMPVEAQAPIMEAPKPKKSNGVLIGLIFAIVVALGGIGFGVFMLLNNNTVAADYEKQISSLKSTNANLQNQLDEVEMLNGDEALTLLQTAATAQSAPYAINYANVYARYSGDEDITAYWVKYMATSTVDGAMILSNIIFTMSDDGDWDFTLPGFTTYTQELADNYTALNGSTITVPVAPTPAPTEPTEEATEE